MIKEWKNKCVFFDVGIYDGGGVGGIGDLLILFVFLLGNWL